MEQRLGRCYGGTETIAATLATRGLFAARRVGFEGARIERQEVALDGLHARQHDALCRVFGVLEASGLFADRHDKCYFYGRQLAVAKSFLVSCRVQACAERVCAWVQSGGQAVVSLLNTGEALADRCSSSVVGRKRSAQRSDDDESGESGEEDDGRHAALGEQAALRPTQMA
eukprot:2825757-Prymnesium_polylepis.1